MNNILFAALNTIGLLLSSTELNNKDLCAPWQPPEFLSKIPFKDDCSKTNGDIGVATPKGIFWCSKVAELVDYYDPGASVFYYAHEYGHYVAGSNELETDCWAAKQLAGTCHVKNAVSHFMRWGDQYKNNYGYMRDRAANIERCANSK